MHLIWIYGIVLAGELMDVFKDCRKAIVDEPAPQDCFVLEVRGESMITDVQTPMV